ncbi:hypothetical protein BG000_006868 [Podila horticola]|nr:hypothetical protein BG000_006868 [Podila horticola]
MSEKLDSLVAVSGSSHLDPSVNQPNTDWSDKVEIVSSPGFSDISLKIPTHLHLWIETLLDVHPVLYVVNVANPVEAPQVCAVGKWKAETRMFWIWGASRGLFGSKDDEVEHILADKMKVADVFGVLDEPPMVLCGQESFACCTLLDVDYNPKNRSYYSAKDFVDSGPVCEFLLVEVLEDHVEDLE